MERRVLFEKDRICPRCGNKLELNTNVDIKRRIPQVDNSAILICPRANCRFFVNIRYSINGKTQIFEILPENPLFNANILGLKANERRK